MTTHSEPAMPPAAAGLGAIVGDIEFPTTWTAFLDTQWDAPLLSFTEERKRSRLRQAQALGRDDAALMAATRGSVPTTLEISGRTLVARQVSAINHQVDFRRLLGNPLMDRGTNRGCDITVWGQVAYVFVPLHVAHDMDVTLGIGADCWLRAWVNGKLVLDRTDAKAPMNEPVTMADEVITVSLTAGDNLLSLRFVSGCGSSLLALCGPRELRARHFQSIETDPLLGCDPRWLRPELEAKPADKGCVEVGSRLELFVDDFLIDRFTGGARRRLHHPSPREVVMSFGQQGQPWEGNAGYPALVEDAGRVLLYYSGRPARCVGDGDESPKQVTCLAQSDDGIHFTRSTVGLHTFNGSTDNNIVWRGTPSHNFTPFRDDNPQAKPAERFKAVGYHPDGGGLGAFASPDGLRWTLLTDQRIFGPMHGQFDSQNVAFWDAARGHYRCYYRGGTDVWHVRVRSIAVATSLDFVHWTESRDLEYADDRLEHMYTNGIRPYVRAPHILIGTPARFVPGRKRVADWVNGSVSDAILMISRDGVRFQRWEQGFIRPAAEPEVWTDRNNYPAWGMVQTSPAELSVYWSEHFKHPTARLRRGVLRTDGFVSIQAGDEVGEMLTRPMLVTGGRLVINFATSAIGAVRCELCDEAGRALNGLSLADSDLIFGNQIEQVVTWNGRGDLPPMQGRPVRLRVRLHDADLYSIRFTG